MSRRLNDDWPESIADQEAAHLPSTPTEFDKELERIMNLRGNDAHNHSVSEKVFTVGMTQPEAIEAIKQVVDKHVIGDFPMFSSTMPRKEKEAINAITNTLHSQRQSLWGKK